MLDLFFCLGVLKKFIIIIFELVFLVFLFYLKINKKTLFFFFF